MARPDIIRRSRPDISGVTIGLYGRRNVGKTTAALGSSYTGPGLPEPLVLSCESGEDAFVEIDVVVTRTADRLREIVAWIASECQEGEGGRLIPSRGFPYRSILVDGFSSLYGETADEKAGRSLQTGVEAERSQRQERTKKGKDAGYGAEHRDAIVELMPVIRTLKMLRLPVIITMHQREWVWPIVGKDGWPLKDPRTKEPIVGRGTRPDLAPRIDELIENQLDVLAYCYRDRVTGERVFLAAEVVEERRIIHAKDRFSGALSTDPNPDYGKKGSRNEAGLMVGPSGFPVDQALIPSPRPLTWASFAEPLRELYQAAQPALAPSPDEASAEPVAVPADDTVES